MSELVPATQSTKIEYAKNLSGSNLLPKQYQNNPANLLFAIEFAEALDMKPIHAITSIHVINGKPSASADLIGTLVRRAGHKLRVTGDDTFAEAVLVRKDDPDFEFKARWDLAKAKQAGLNTPTWKSYPGAMLKARAITEVCRAGAPDAMHGIQYSTEELESLGGSGGVESAASVLADPVEVEEDHGFIVVEIPEAKNWAGTIATSNAEELREMWQEHPDLRAQIEAEVASRKANDE